MFLQLFDARYVPQCNDVVSVFVVENTNVFCAIRNNKRNRKIDWRYILKMMK